MLIIDEELLECQEDVALYNGVPFTGIARYHHASGNSLKRECPYIDGFEEGTCREWHENGLLQREWIAVHGRAEGKVKLWHDNGVIKTVGEYFRGVELSFKEYNRTGNLVAERTIDPESILYKYAMMKVD